MNNIKTYDNSYNFYRILYLYHIFLLSNNIFIYIEDHTHSPSRARSTPDFISYYDIIIIIYILINNVIYTNILFYYVFYIKTINKIFFFGTNMNNHFNNIGY